MAVIEVGNAYLQSDSRFTRWAKVVRTRADLNIKLKGGYAITAAFVQWGKAVAVAPGEYVVFAAETGSRHSVSYDYALWRVSPEDKMAKIEWKEVEQVADSPKLNDAAKAACRNSRLYAIASYCYRQLPPLLAPEPKPEQSANGLTAEENTLLADAVRAIAAIRALPADRRAIVNKAIIDALPDLTPSMGQRTMPTASVPEPPVAPTPDPEIPAVPATEPVAHRRSGRRF